jgi:hypothetical protein
MPVNDTTAGSALPQRMQRKGDMGMKGDVGTRVFRRRRDKNLYGLRDLLG